MVENPFMPQTVNSQIIVFGGALIRWWGDRLRAAIDYVARTAKDLTCTWEKATLGALIWWADTITTPVAVVKSLRAS